MYESRMSIGDSYLIDNYTIPDTRSGAWVFQNMSSFNMSSMILFVHISERETEKERDIHRKGNWPEGQLIWKEKILDSES